MSAEPNQKAKGEKHEKGSKHEKGEKAEKPEKKEKKEKKDKKAEATDAAAPAAAAPPKAPPVPHAPADPRRRMFEKLDGRFLPKGPLRDRLKALMVRWHSGPDHGGVTLEELKSVHDDWKSARA